MGRSRTVIVAALLAAVFVAAPAAGEAGPPPVVYQAPVPGPIIEPFRPPTSPYGPGNRGVDYATVPGEPVAAPADGLVTFAGPVAGTLHVVVLHADGIRTSMSFLAGVRVTRGQRVGRGQPVGWAGSTVHFGARRGELYLDPTSLLSAGGPGGATAAVLVPDGPGRPLGVEEEAAGLRRL
ncbi:MAG TPA: M23 family metallopeptidase, partial [Acidimicrobiales bacterium]|nr:M23 family metallopeptidase [Acidimicrobiales bacterium]